MLITAFYQQMWDFVVICGKKYFTFDS